MSSFFGIDDIAKRKSGKIAIASAAALSVIVLLLAPLIFLASNNFGVASAQVVSLTLTLSCTTPEIEACPENDEARYDKDTITASFDAMNIPGPDANYRLEINWGDGSPVENQEVDESAVYEAFHIYGPSSSGQTVTIVGNLYDASDNPVTEDSENAMVLKHQAAFRNMNSPSSLIWHKGGTVEADLVDEDDNDNPIDAADVNLSGTAVEGGPLTELTDTSGFITFDFIGAKIPFGSYPMSLDYAETDLFYSAHAELAFNLDRHGISTSVETLDPETLEAETTFLWGKDIKVRIEATDDDVVNVDPSKQNEVDTPTSPSGLQYNVDDDGLAASVPATTSSPVIITGVVSQNLGASVPVTATFDGDNYYSDDTETSNIAIEQRHMDIRNLALTSESIEWGFTDTLGGLVVDTDDGDNPISGIDVALTGDAVFDDGASGPTDEFGNFAVDFVVEKVVGSNIGITATASHPLYVTDVDSTEEVDSVNAHPSTTQITPISNPVKWGYFFDVEVTVTDDLYATASANGVNAPEQPAGFLVSIDDSDNPTNAADPGNGPYEATTTSPVTIPVIASQNTGTGKTVAATSTYTGPDNLYTGSSDSETTTIIRHLTEFRNAAGTSAAGPSLPGSAKWYFDFPTSGPYLFDIEATTDGITADPAPIPGKATTFTGTAIDGGGPIPASANTGLDGAVPATSLIASSPAGSLRGVEVSFAEEPAAGGLYEGTISDTSTMTILRHATEFREITGVTPAGPSLPASAKWYYDFLTNPGPYLVDADKGGVNAAKGEATPLFVDDRPTTFTGTAIDGGGPIPASANTGLDGAVPATSLIASSPAGANRDVIAHFAGDAEEDGLYSMIDSMAATMTIDRHATTLTIGDIPTTPWSRPISPSGTLSDADRAGVSSSKMAATPTGPSSKAITFTGTGVGTVTSTLTAGAIYTVSGKAVTTTSYPDGGTITLDQLLTFTADPGIISVTASVSGQGSGVTPISITPTVSPGSTAEERTVSLGYTIATDGILNEDSLGTIRVEVGIPNAASLFTVGSTGTDDHGGLTITGSQTVMTVIAAPGSYFTTGNAPPAPCNPGTPDDLICTPGLLIQANFADEAAEGGLYTGNPSNTDSYDTTQHTTAIDFDFINEDIDPFSNLFRSPLTGRIFTIGGTLIDTTANTQVTQTGKEITFSGTGAGPLSSTTTKPIAFIHDTDPDGVVISQCVFIPPELESETLPAVCASDPSEVFGADPTPSFNNILELSVGGKVDFPTGSTVVDAQLFLDDIGSGTVYFTVHENNGDSYSDQISGGGIDAPTRPILTIISGTTPDGFGVPVAHGIDYIDFTGVDPDGEDGPAYGQLTDPSDPLAIVPIAAISSHDLASSLQYSNSFEAEALGIKSLDVENKFVVETGTFFTFGIAPVDAASGLEIEGSFDGDSDPDYIESSASGMLDIVLDTSGLSVTAIGGTATVTTGHLGESQTGYTCTTDIDRDAQCDGTTGWDKSTAANININGATIPRPVPMGTDKKDILFLYMCMPGYCPTTAEWDTVENLWNLGPKANADLDGIARNYRVQSVLMREDLPLTFPTKVWSSTSSSYLKGKETFGVSDGTCNPTCTYSISGVFARTTGAVTNAKRDFVTVVTLGTTNPGTVTANVGTITGFNAAGSLITSETATINSVTTSLVGTVYKSTVKGTITYSISGLADTDAKGPMGTIPIILNVPTGNPTITTSSLTIGLGSQRVTSNTDADGMIRSYFGTDQQIQTAGGPLSMKTKNMVALKAVSHTMLFVRSLGPDKFTCGSSGVSETPGRNSIIGLGAKRDALDTIDINCFTGAFGSSNERMAVAAHEGLHNMGVRHGGGDDLNCKPNYPSVMNYCLTRPGVVTNWVLGFSKQALATADERPTPTGPGLPESNVLQLSSAIWGTGATRDVAYGNGAGVLKTATITTSPTSINWNVGTAGDTGTGQTITTGIDLNYISTVPGADVAAQPLTALVGYNDYASQSLNHLSNGAAFYSPPGSDQCISRGGQNEDRDCYGDLTDTVNEGIVVGPLTPLTYVAQPDLPDNVRSIKARDSVGLKFRYFELLDPTKPITIADLRGRLFQMIDTDPSAKFNYQINPNMCDGRPAYNPSNPQPGQCDPVLGIVPKPNPPSNGDSFRYDGKQNYWIYNAATENLSSDIWGFKVWRNGVATDSSSHIVDNGSSTPDSDGFMFFFRVTSK